MRQPAAKTDPVRSAPGDDEERSVLGRGPGAAGCARRGREARRASASETRASGWRRAARVLQVVHRVGHRAVDARLEMEVGTGGEACAAGEADDLALAHMLADADLQH